MFDIIGDIHGHASALERLLIKLGYELRADGWQQMLYNSASFCHC